MILQLGSHYKNLLIMKKGCAILFLFLTLMGYGQNSTLLQNINYRAKELKHSLNKTGDTLILNGERQIDKVEIFNNDFEDVFEVDSKTAQISLNEIPEGRFVVEVKVEDKLIIITLIRHNSIALEPQKTVMTKEEDEASNAFSTNKGKANLSIPKSESTYLEKQPITHVKFYWIVKDINKGHSSSKIKRIGDKSVVESMIAQHKIDLQTKAGKNNSLTIWEVYDTTKFLRFKRRNPDYANIDSAECFNVVPFYTTEIEK